MLNLKPPRHTPTLPIPVDQCADLNLFVIQTDIHAPDSVSALYKGSFLSRTDSGRATWPSTGTGSALPYPQ
jgi:hypothetical protein